MPITPDGEISIEKDLVIPSWIKNNAGWWAENSISDSDFFIWNKNFWWKITLFSSNLMWIMRKLGILKNTCLIGTQSLTIQNMHMMGSIRLQNKFFDYVDYTVKYDAALNRPYDTSETNFTRCWCLALSNYWA